MKLNNGIKKPMISVGFDKTGRIVYNIDKNKINGLNTENYVDLVNVLKNATVTVDAINKIKPKKSNNKVEIQKKGLTKNNRTTILGKFESDSGIKVPNNISGTRMSMVIRNINAGYPLQAIKQFKSYTNCGLKEAKMFLDWYNKNYK